MRQRRRRGSGGALELTSLHCDSQGLDLSQSRTFRYVKAMGPVMAGVQQMEGMIEEAIGSFTNEGVGKKVVVFMDGVDFMMAALELGAAEMLDMIGRIREVSFGFFTSQLPLQCIFHFLSTEFCEIPQVTSDIMRQHDNLKGLMKAELKREKHSHLTISGKQQTHSLILATSADSPLLHSRTSPLEINHAAFVVGLAHQARVVISLNGLETGAAKDVSGVLRVGRGGAAEYEEDEDIIQEKEVLYFVGGDGGVRVFERGA